MVSAWPAWIVDDAAVADRVVPVFAAPVVSAAVFVLVVASAVLVMANAVALADIATAPPTRILVRSLRMICLPLGTGRCCAGITCRQRLAPVFCYRSRSGHEARARRW